MSHLVEPLGALLLGGYLPEQASSVAPGVDRVFALLFWVSAFFLALIVGLTVTFVVRYRRRPGRTEPEASPDHSTRLEVFWSVIPLVLVFVIFGVSTTVYGEMTTTPPGAAPLEVKVTAKRWSWWFDHPGGKGAKELHLVAGRPVELVLGSLDVIHSLYVPSFRLKQDAVPGRYTRMAFTPTKAGTFPIVCAEYCGTNHSKMDAVAVVHEDQASFDAWAKEGMGPDLSLVDLGKKLFDEKGCTACHSVDGSVGVGPSLKGLWGRTEKLAGGGSVMVDENYLRESIVSPSAKVVAGFDDVMPPQPLEERELLALIAYLQSLKETP
jgi:cytochrome c oxidase subunit II